MNKIFESFKENRQIFESEVPTTKYLKKVLSDNIKVNIFR